MLPNTRALLDYIRQDRQIGGGLDQYYAQMQAEQPSAHMGRVDLEISKRRRMQMIKEMLKNAGYEDIARMTRPVERKYDPNDI